MSQRSFRAVSPLSLVIFLGFARDEGRQKVCVEERESTLGGGFSR